MAQVLSNATTVRAEEIVLHVPDGRSVTTLINATPIHSEDGTVESMVVTLQDLAPLEELEPVAGRVPGHGEPRVAGAAEFDQGVGRDCAGRIAGAEPGRDASVFPDHRGAGRFHARPDRRLLDAGHIEAGTLPVAPEPAELAGLVEQARNTFLSGGRRHSVQIDLPPDLPPGTGRPGADRAGLEQPLLQRLQNTPRGDPHPGRRCAGRRSRGGFGDGRRPGRAAGAAAAPVPKIRPWRRRRSGARARRDRPGAWPFARGSWRPTGAGSGPRAADRTGARASPSRFRWLKSRRRRGGRFRRECLRNHPGEERERNAHPCGGRRPPDAPLRSGRPRRCRLLSAW